MKMWHINTRVYYSAVEKNEIMNFADEQVELEKTVFNEIIQIQTNVTWSFLSEDSSFKSSDLSVHILE